MRQSGYYYVYPAYFEAGRSRKSGRRIPKKLALQSVDVELIVLAARRLKLEYQVKPDARYPPSWWGTPGLVLIRKTAERPKTQLLKELAEKMKALKRKPKSKSK
jgi:signal recognition particle subunit SRP19